MGDCIDPASRSQCCQTCMGYIEPDETTMKPNSQDSQCTSDSLWVTCQAPESCSDPDTSRLCCNTCRHYQQQQQQQQQQHQQRVDTPITSPLCMYGQGDISSDCADIDDLSDYCSTDPWAGLMCCHTCGLNVFLDDDRRSTK